MYILLEGSRALLGSQGAGPGIPNPLPRERGATLPGTRKSGCSSNVHLHLSMFWLNFYIALCHSGGTRGTKDPKDRGTSALLELKWLGDKYINVLS